MSFKKYFVQLFIVSTATISPMAMADIATKNFIACVSEDVLGEVTDVSSLKQLVSAGQCIFIKTGTEITVIRHGFMIATILYKGVKLFTESEMVK